MQPCTIQIVIARANTPDAETATSRTASAMSASATCNPQEYFSYLDPVTYGHNSADGAIGVAAYRVLRAVRARGFTSPGPSTIYFDKDNRRLRHRGVSGRSRILAAMDGANTTFFSGGFAVDADTFPNFFGTSAAAPHAAAIAALVLDAAGGPGLGQTQEDARDPAGQRLPRTTSIRTSRRALRFREATCWRSTRSADPNAISQFDPNVFTVTHFGSTRAREPVDQRQGANPTKRRAASCSTSGRRRCRHRASRSSSGSHGRSDAARRHGHVLAAGRSAGRRRASGSSSTSRSVPGSFAQRRSAVVRRRSRRSGCQRVPSGAAGGNSADLLGGGVLIPSGRFVPGGASFFGTFEGGCPFQGRVLQPDRQRLQPARRLRLHQRGSGGESGAEEDVNENRRLTVCLEGPHWQRCGPFHFRETHYATRALLRT